MNFRLHASLALLYQVLITKRVPATGSRHRTNTSSKLTSFFVFSMWKKLEFILAAAADLQQRAPCYRDPRLRDPGEKARRLQYLAERRSTGSAANGLQRGRYVLSPLYTPSNARALWLRAKPPGRNDRATPRATRPPAARGGSCRGGSRPRAAAPPSGPRLQARGAERGAAGGAGCARPAFPPQLLSLKPSCPTSPLSSCLSPSVDSCLKNSVSRQTAWVTPWAPLGRAWQGARSDQTKSPISVQPLLFQEKLSPGPGSHHPVWENSYQGQAGGTQCQQTLVNLFLPLAHGKEAWGRSCFCCMLCWPPVARRGHDRAELALLVLLGSECLS